MCPAVKKSIDSYWGLSLFPSPALICSVTSDKTTFLFGSHSACETGYNKGPKSAMAIPNAGQQNLPSTEQRRALPPASAASSSSRLEIFASFGHPSLAQLGQYVLWRALRDPWGSIMPLRSKPWCSLAVGPPLPLPSPGETVRAQQTFASTKLATELSRTYAYIITVI